jgi:hypothetical protein
MNPNLASLPAQMPGNQSTVQNDSGADKSKPGQGTKPAAAVPPPPEPPASEEPDMVLESDLPSDGRDEVGEAMICDLPQRPELSEPPSQPDSSNTST